MEKKNILVQLRVKKKRNRKTDISRVKIKWRSNFFVDLFLFLFLTLFYLQRNRLVQTSKKQKSNSHSLTALYSQGKPISEVSRYSVIDSSYSTRCKIIL
ncbi:hypothetical protein FQR65_LT06570 [Abscondita terminalis]|nr:hypothetical protein FQR65_LT06570 [Abscondita terminalis]